MAGYLFSDPGLSRGISNKMVHRRFIEMVPLKPPRQKLFINSKDPSFSASLAVTINTVPQRPFDSVDAFQQSFGPHAEEILGDLPNFTNVQPTIQISEIKI